VHVQVLACVKQHRQLEKSHQSVGILIPLVCHFSGLDAAYSCAVLELATVLSTAVLLLMWHCSVPVCTAVLRRNKC